MGSRLGFRLDPMEVSFYACRFLSNDPVLGTDERVQMSNRPELQSGKHFLSLDPTLHPIKKTRCQLKSANTSQHKEWTEEKKLT